MTRPTPVLVALILLAIDWVVGWRGLTGWRVSGFGTVGLISLGFNLSIKALFAWVWFNLARGRNWARILLVILTAFGIFGIAAEFWMLTNQPAGTSLAADMAEVGWTLLPPILRLIAIGLLFGPGCAWFSRTSTPS